MKITSRIPAISLLPAILLSGCQQQPVVVAWPLTQAEAFSRLQHADIAGFARAETCGGVNLEFVANPKGDKAIEWQANSGFNRVASFTVRLEAAGPNATTALIEVPADPQGGEIYDGSKHYPRPMLQQPLRPAIQELIDSAMEQRAFDAMKLAGQITPDPACGGKVVLAKPPAPKPQSNQDPAATGTAESAPQQSGGTPVNPDGNDSGHGSDTSPVYQVPAAPNTHSRD